MSETIFDRIGSNLQSAREAKGLTLNALSKKCGIAESNLCAYESGNTMSLKTFIKIVNALDVDFDSILSDTKTIYFESRKANITSNNIANAIEYLLDKNILVRKRIPEEYPNNMDIYSGCNEHAFIEPETLKNNREYSQSDPYNSIIVSYPYSIPILEYCSSLAKNVNYVTKEDEKELLYKIYKTILINELEDIKNKY